MKNNRWLNLCNILMVVFAVVVIVFDLVTKYVIESKMSLGQEGSFLPGFMNFVIVHNDGAAWNLFSGFQILLIVVTFIFLLVFLWLFFTKKSKSVLLGIASGLLLGGCLGNLYDRIAFGYVRDFLNFQFMNFPVFNVADACLCIGVVLLAIYFIFIYSKETKLEKEKLEKQGILLEGDVDISTEDLDKVKTSGFKLRNNLNIKKIMQYRSEQRVKAKKDVKEKEIKD